MDLAGRRAIVLGGSSGIGLAAARALAASGADVIAASRSQTMLDSAAAQLPESVRFEAVDVLDRDALTRLFQSAAPFDVLVNAATGGPRASGPFLEMDLDDFQGSFAKLWGYTNSVRLAAEHMSPDASIVLVSGFPARKCGPGASAISTVGNAVEGFVRAVAPELAPRRINAVSPGIIDTPMFSMPADARDAFLATATQGFAIPRPGSAEEVATAILFALQNDYVTGTTIDVDGGALLP